MPKREPLSTTMTIDKHETTATLQAAKAVSEGNAAAIKKHTTPIQDKKLIEYIEIAKKAQAQRLKAPLVGVRAKYSSPMKSQINRLSADTGGQDGQYHWYYGNAKKAGEYARSGYEPVVENGEQVNANGSPLWKIPIAFHQAELNAVVARDKEQLRVKTRRDTKNIKHNNPHATEQVTMTRDGVDLLE
jgi:hypothetical protein